MSEFLTIKEASVWASEHLKKDVTTSNISYLVSYGKIRKTGNNGSSLNQERRLRKILRIILRQARNKLERTVG